MDVLKERAKTHGDFEETANIALGLKTELRRHIESRKEKHHHCLLNTQQESLEMICTKIARILSGDPNEPDHWRDIAGYAQLVVNSLDSAPEVFPLVDLNDFIKGKPQI